MKKRAVCAMVCTAILCCACAVAPQAMSGTKAVANARVIQNETQHIAQATATPLVVTVGEETYQIPAYQVGDQIKRLDITDPDQLPQLPKDRSADVKIIWETTSEHGVDEKPVFEGDESEYAAFVPNRNGAYVYQITPGGEGPEYRFAVEVHCTPRVRLSANGAKLGATLAVYVEYADDLTVSSWTNLKHQPSFYKVSGGQMALLPISYYTEPGEYQLAVTVGEQKFEYKINANQRDFVVQNLWVEESTASSTINNDAATLEWNEKIEPLKAITDPEKYWDGPFLMPVKGRTTTEFGTIRYTNGSKDASRHGALDIAAATGTPVPAANAGRVIFAQFIQMSGNVVVIEHGLGLKTWYFHMSKIDVQEGQMVKKGDIIGKVGATGFVTGPHLHFGLSVNEVYIDPADAISNGIG